MRVYCPNCGTDNDGMPGGRVTCKACTASFEVPRDQTAPPPVQAPPPPVQAPASRPFPGYVGPPPTGFGVSNQAPAGATNTLAIVSLVLGLLCCLPFASIGAIVTGVIAQNQINQSMGAQKGRELALAGIILGALGLASSLLWIIGSAARGFR